MSSSVPIPGGGNPWSPTPPDFHMCDQAYGRDLQLSDCFTAVESLPTGEGEMTYTINSVNPSPWNFPSYRTHG